jgi:hypothetical protein
MVNFRCGTHMAPVLGVVDSGADGTLLPKSMAAELGLDAATDLVSTNEGSGGAGGTSFKTWTTTSDITGRVVAFAPDGPELWGPVVTFRPVFADGELALFGRADFFRSFRITFETNSTHGPIFHLDC